MYNFILYQWKLGQFDIENVQLCVTKEYITQEQADIILIIPQVVV